MSTFRPPQVPQQPRTFFPFGQPLGIPIPCTDYQMQQRAAYGRERPQMEAMEQALGIVDVSTPRAPIAAFVPAVNLPLILPPPRTSLEALEQALQLTDQTVTPGQALGIPAPRTEHQMAAYFPPHPIAIEILSEQLETAFTQGLARGNPIPQQGDQTAAYRRERPSLEAMEQATQLTDQSATVGQALGTPNPVQGDQSAALWHSRAEILQPTAYLSSGSAPLFVPAPWLPIPSLVSWRFEWLVDFLQPSFTPSQQLGVPQPQQSDQSVAYRRERASLEALQQALIRGSTQSGIVVFVPASPLQTVAPNQWRFEWLVDLLTPNVTAGAVPTAPIPRQSEQTASYWRVRAEIQQQTTFAPRPSVQTFVPSVSMPVTVTRAVGNEAAQAATRSFAPQTLAFVPGLFVPMPRPVSWRYEWMIGAVRSIPFSAPSSAAVAATRLVVAYDLQRLTLTYDSGRLALTEDCVRLSLTEDIQRLTLQ